MSLLFRICGEEQLLLLRIALSWSQFHENKYMLFPINPRGIFHFADPLSLHCPSPDDVLLERKLLPRWPCSQIVRSSSVGAAVGAAVGAVVVGAGAEALTRVHMQRGAGLHT